AAVRRGVTSASSITVLPGPLAVRKYVLGHCAPCPPKSYVGVLRERLTVGKRTNAPWTRCHTLEPAWCCLEPRSPGAAGHVRWGRAGPSGAHVSHEAVRRLSIRGDLSPAECQSVGRSQ